MLRKGWVSIAIGILFASTFVSPSWGSDQEIEQIRKQIQSQQRLLEQLQKRLEELEKKRPDQPPSEKKPSVPSFQFSGYIQWQTRRDAGERVNVTEEELRRARLKADVRLGQRAGATLQLEMAREVEVKDAYVDLKFPPQWGVRVGQFKIPFSSQILESSGARLAPERALINLRTVPGERDRGILLTYQWSDNPRWPLQVQGGVFNGAGPNRNDNNTDKDFILSIATPATPLALRVSFLQGRFRNPSQGGQPGGEVTKRRWGIDARYNRGPWIIEGQYAQGKGDSDGQRVSTTDVQGYYLQVAYKIPNIPLFPLVRWQHYDPDTHTPRNSIQGPLVGFVYDPTHFLRYTLAWEQLNDRSRPGRRNTLILRAQLHY